MLKNSEKGLLTIVPHLYIDTNIFAEVADGQHLGAVHLVESIRDKGWRCSTSIFTLMELADIRQDNKYVYNQLGRGTHVKKAFRSLDQRDLSSSDLNQIQKQIDKMFSVSYPFCEFYSLEEKGWDKALDLKAKTNISAPDSIHLATAIEAGCDLLVSLDSFFIKQAGPFIKTCVPDQANKILTELGFTI
jgi:predicted nucleic acid-binding protein